MFGAPDRNLTGTAMNATRPHLTGPSNTCRGLTWTRQNPSRSDLIRQNLTKSDIRSTEFPAHSNKFADNPRRTSKKAISRLIS